MNEIHNESIKEVSQTRPEDSNFDPDKRVEVNNRPINGNFTDEDKAAIERGIELFGNDDFKDTRTDDQWEDSEKGYLKPNYEYTAGENDENLPYADKHMKMLLFFKNYIRLWLLVIQQVNKCIILLTPSNRVAIIYLDSEYMVAKFHLFILELSEVFNNDRLFYCRIKKNHCSFNGNWCRNYR